MAQQLINGKVYDWSSVTIGITGTDGIEPTEISYDDETGKEPIYGKAGKMRGYGTGNKKNSVKISMLREDFNELCRVIKASGKKFYDYNIPQITVAYADDGKPTCTDVLKDVSITKRSFKASQGDNSLKVDLDGIAYGGIVVNGLEA